MGARRLAVHMVTVDMEIKDEKHAISRGSYQTGRDADVAMIQAQEVATALGFIPYLDGTDKGCITRGFVRTREDQPPQILYITHSKNRVDI
jgi:hypothetical protein